MPADYFESRFFAYTRLFYCFFRHSELLVQIKNQGKKEEKKRRKKCT